MKKLLKIGLTRIEKIILWLLIYLPRLKKNTDEVILLRTDNIGDYILFRNLLPFIRDAEQYRNRRLIMIGNIAWSNLAEHFDHQFIDKFIWIDTPRYQQSRRYRLTIFLKMFSIRAAELINTVHSRSYLTNDLTLLCRAKKRISSFGDSINLPNEASKQASDALFDVLLPSLSNIDFEFYRNKTFIEHLIGQSIELLKPNFNEIKKEIKSLQILIFPSAHSTLRRWDTDRKSVV